MFLMPVAIHNDNDIDNDDDIDNGDETKKQ